MKKDSITKIKVSYFLNDFIEQLYWSILFLQALKEVEELIDRKNEKLVIAMMQVWPRLYSKLAIDGDFKVREVMSWLKNLTIHFNKSDFSVLIWFWRRLPENLAKTWHRIWSNLWRFGCVECLTRIPQLQMLLEIHSKALSQKKNASKCFSIAEMK